MCETFISAKIHKLKEQRGVASLIMNLSNNEKFHAK